MGVPGKTFKKMAGLIGAKIIKQEKWIELRNFAIAESSMQMYSGAFDCGLTPDDFPDFSIFHHYNLPLSYSSLLFT